MSGPTLKGMFLPDDVLSAGIDWRCTENGKTATSGQTLVATAGKTADSPADKASATGLGTVGKGRIKPKHKAKIQRRKFKYALQSAQGRK